MPSVVTKYFHLQPSWPVGEPQPPSDVGAGLLLLLTLQRRDQLVSPSFQMNLMRKSRESIRVKARAVGKTDAAVSLQSNHKSRVRLKRRFLSKGVEHEEVA